MHHSGASPRVLCTAVLHVQVSIFCYLPHILPLPAPSPLLQVRPSLDGMGLGVHRGSWPGLRVVSGGSGGANGADPLPSRHRRRLGGGFLSGGSGGGVGLGICDGDGDRRAAGGAAKVWINEVVWVWFLLVFHTFTLACTAHLCTPAQGFFQRHAKYKSPGRPPVKVSVDGSVGYGCDAAAVGNDPGHSSVTGMLTPRCAIQSSFSLCRSLAEGISPSRETRCGVNQVWEGV